MNRKNRSIANILFEIKMIIDDNYHKSDSAKIKKIKSIFKLYQKYQQDEIESNPVLDMDFSIEENEFLNQLNALWNVIGLDVKNKY